MIFPRQTGIICWKIYVRAIIPEKMSKFWGLVLKILYMDVTQIDAFFAFFGNYFIKNLKILGKSDLIFYKPLSRALIPEKMSSNGLLVQEIMQIRFWEFWMIQKIFFEKIFFSTQNHLIRVKNMFSWFSIFFPKKLP